MTLVSHAPSLADRRPVDFRSTSEVRIRKAGVDDLPAVVGLWEEMMRHHAGQHPDFEMGGDAREVMMGQYRDMLSREDCCIFVAELDVGIVGLLVAQLRPPPSFRDGPGSGYFRDVVVKEGHRGKGVGRRLAEAGIEFCRSRGAAFIDLLAGSANEEANRFWESLGFRESLKLRTLRLDGRGA